MTDDLLEGMTGDYKNCYLYTEKVVVRRMGGERFRYVAVCGQRFCCWGEITHVARAGMLGTGVLVSLFRKVPMGAKAYLKTVGSEAYVQFPTFVAINEGCVCTCESLMEGVRCVDPWLAWVQKSPILGWLGFRNL